LPFSGQITCVAYNPVNGWFYVSTVYPTTTKAYDTNGNLQTLSGTFINNAPVDQIGGMAIDPVSGNVYLATNQNKTYGFDKNGNALPAPWHTITTIGSGSGDAGLAVVPAL
jgi:DNA-binding beta-propeller fold protein YncE